MIDYDELTTLRAICRHHGADDAELIANLARLIEWVHQSEQAKHGLPQPPFLLVLESLLGLHSRPRRGQEEAVGGLVAV